MNQLLIRNFCIIAHIDHGKSTLADRLLEITGTVLKRDLVEQTLDSHPVSRERGITIRLSPVTMHYQDYILNLIDTPGHVDFSYEVERSLAACEGTILLVDATQGIQAQTLSHLQKALRLDLKIIPAVNKVDMPNAKVSETVSQLAELLHIKETEIFKISAKTGFGVKELLDEVINQVPAPSGLKDSPPRALIFSSQFDSQRGVIAFIRVIDGRFQIKDGLKFLATKGIGDSLEIGHFTPPMTACESLETGEVGYIITNIKDPAKVRVGDTITTSTAAPLPGYREPQPMVFVSFFPVDQDEFALLEDALKKLRLNDAAVSFVPTNSKALGRGFRCGFLGHLHAEVSQERLESEFNLAIIATSPTVQYEKTGENFEEPWVESTIITPSDYVGAIITLCEDRRGKLTNMVYHGTSVTLSYELPLAEIITDFFDQLKSKSSGFASFDYEFLEYRPFDAVQLDILINHEAIDAFAQILEKTKAERYGKNLVEKLAKIIPRQQIPIPIQASINNQIIARADIQAFRKDVTAKLYGGDVTRRMKLLEKQKKGKEKMKSIGKVQIPNDTFLKVFKT